MRGSDPDAAVYYLAAMLEGGEDARFIARRMIVLASEDIGNADPQALVVAIAAAHAVEYVGLPEARLNLSQAAIYLALAPKSNASYVAIKEATADVREGGNTRPPKALRDAHYPGAKKLGHGEGYIYPHDDPGRVRRRLPPRRAEGQEVLPAMTLNLYEWGERRRRSSACTASPRTAAGSTGWPAPGGACVAPDLLGPRPLALGAAVGRRRAPGGNPRVGAATSHAVWVGHSFGGRLVAELAARDPERVERPCCSTRRSRCSRTSRSTSPSCERLRTSPTRASRKRSQAPLRLRPRAARRRTTA